MSHDSGKWGRLGRARSDVALNRNDPPPHIPEDGEALPSPSTPRINISSPAVLTPPKKAWERHYRSFLKRTTSSSPGQVQTPPSPGNRKGKSELDDNVSQQSNGGSYRSSKFFLVPGSKRLLTRQLPDKQPQQGSAMPSMPVLTKGRSQSNGDMTVKGGNFFSQVFHKHDTSAKSKSSSPVVARKIKSMDALDSTIRRGQEKTYSPKNQRFVHTDMELGGPPGPGSATPPLVSSTSTTPHGSPLPLHPSSPRSPHTKAPALLPKALSSSGTAKKPASTEIKKAFTEFHNSATFSKDSTSAYLGDDTSATGNTYFAMYNQMATQHKDSSHSERRPARSTRSTSMLSRSLDPVVEGSLLAKSQRMLKPVVGPEAWSQGRRYLISPAILATCPMLVLPTLAGNRKITTFDESLFGALELGAATMSYIGTRKQASGWSACTLVLRQNYLLEYDRETVGTPRGFAHLQNSRAKPHVDFHNALELEFFGSPCAKADKRKLLIRVENTSDRDRWVTCLNRAAALTVSDLYEFDESKLIGTGRYATVYRARRRENMKSHPECAIKIVDKNEFWGRVVKGMERADTLVREAAVQATLTTKGDKLPTVVKIRSLFETSDSFVLEVELLEGTDLFHHVSSKSVLDESEAASIVRDILVSLEAMNRFGVAHRDIKPANILMCDKAKDGVNVKVADFGMATFVGVDGQLRGRCGTPGYVAPEIFSAGIHGGYGNKVDIFSAGVTLYVMLCGYEPFYGETDAELIDANREAQVEFPDDDWKKVSLGARELVEAMLKADPKKRISAKGALQHPWVNSHTESTTVPSNSAKKFVDGAACTIS